MKTLIRRLLKKKGFLLLSRKEMFNLSSITVKENLGIEDPEIAVITSKFKDGLRGKLIQENLTDWLEIGCGETFDDNFSYIDLFTEKQFPRKGKYFRVDITNPSESDITKIGNFKMIRM